MNSLLRHFRRTGISQSAVSSRIALFVRYASDLILASCLLAFSSATAAAEEWRELNPATKPSARAGHTMVTINGNVYLFGGYENATASVKRLEGAADISAGDGPAPLRKAGAVNDLWKFDGHNWERIADNAPLAPRYLHTAIAYKNKMYVFGGLTNSTTYLSDMWSYSSDTNSWEEVQQKGNAKPQGRSNHSATVTEDGSMIVYGGKTLGGQADPYAWKFDFATETWTRKSANPAGSRDCQGATTIGNKMYVFGGNSGSAKTNDVFGYDPASDAWAKVTTQGTPPDSRAFSATTTEGSSFYIFGGENDNGVAFNDAWEFDTITKIWRRRHDLPSTLTRLSAASQVAIATNHGSRKFSSEAGSAVSSLGQTYHIIFGGVNAYGKYSDKTYQYNTAYALNFAHIGSGLGITSETVFANPSATSAVAAKLEFFDDAGLPTAFNIAAAGSRSSIDFTVPPLGSVGLSTDGGGPLKAGSAVVTSDNVLGGVIRLGIPGLGIAGVGDSAPFNGFVIPVRRKAGGINTGIALRNVEAAAIGLSLTLRNKQGQVVAGGIREISALAGRGHLAQFVNELFPSAATDDFEGTLVVQAVSGKVAAVALEVGSLPGQFTTLPVIALK